MLFENIFFITDADGTLLTDDKKILDIDKTAINEFIANGGLFTIATGRGLSLARVVAEELKLNTPAVIFNGAAIYDFKADKFLWKCTLPPTVKKYIKFLKQKFPALGVEILRGDKIYVTSMNLREEEHLAFGVMEPVICGLDDVPEDNWIKILLADEPEVIDKLIKFCEKQNFNDVYMVRSSPFYYEIIPSGVNKGTGLKKLLELTGISGRCIVAAGDFMNDIEMLRTADFGVAVANAEDCVKEAADFITINDNNEGAMKEIIEHLRVKE